MFIDRLMALVDFFKSCRWSVPANLWPQLQQSDTSQAGPWCPQVLTPTKVTEDDGYLNHTCPSYMYFVVQARGENGHTDFGLTEVALGRVFLLQGMIIAVVQLVFSMHCGKKHYAVCLKSFYHIFFGR